MSDQGTRRKSNEEIETRLSDLEAQIVKYQKKSGSFTNQSGTVAAPSLTFNNLEIGKTYRLSLYGSAQAGTGDASYIEINHAGTFTASRFFGISTASTTGLRNLTGGAEVVFVATATTLTFSTNTNNTNDVLSITLMLEELPTHEVTTQWS